MSRKRFLLPEDCDSPSAPGKSSLTVSTAEGSPSSRLSENSTASRLSVARSENLLDALMQTKVRTILSWEKSKEMEKLKLQRKEELLRETLQGEIIDLQRRVLVLERIFKVVFAGNLTLLLLVLLVLAPQNSNNSDDDAGTYPLSQDRAVSLFYPDEGICEWPSKAVEYYLDDDVPSVNALVPVVERRECANVVYTMTDNSPLEGGLWSMYSGMKYLKTALESVASLVLGL